MIYNKNSRATKKTDRRAASIIDILDQPAALFPDHYLFKYKRNKKECAITYKAFRAEVEFLSRGLLEMNLGGSHIALIGEKSAEWIAFYFAVVNVGGVVVPLDKDLNRDQIPDFIDFADCDAAAYSDTFTGVFENNKAMKSLKCRIRISPDQDAKASEYPEGVISYTNLLKKGELSPSVKAESDVEIKPDTSKMCVIIFTSGTTGSSKGVMLSQDNLTTCVSDAVRYVNIDEDDVLLSILPLHHTYEMTAGILAAMFCGCTICLNESLTSLLADFKTYKPTVLIAVPLVCETMYKKIRETIKKSGRAQIVSAAGKISDTLFKFKIDVRRTVFAEVLAAFGGNLSNIICGGAAMRAGLVDDFKTFGITVQQGYGITECSPIISIIPYEIHNPPSCGLPLEGMQVYIDRENSEDETGEICVKGGNVMLGYYKNPAATGAVLNDRGWFYTGDCGYVDSKNFLYITGRKKNVIVLDNGKNVFPEELEDYIMRIPFVSDCMVSSNKSNEEGGLSLTAIIFPDYAALTENKTEGEAEVNDYFKKKISELNRKLINYKQIRNIVIRNEPFPKTSTHKIQRHKV